VQHTMTAVPSDLERVAVDGVCGPSSEPDGRTSRLGFHQAQQLRHLLLPALWALQDAVGGVSEGGLAYVSDRLLVPPADAYGVATFYSMLLVDDVKETTTYICDDIICRRTVGFALQDDETASPCLGQCDRAPARLQMTAGEVALSITGAESLVTATFPKQITGLIAVVDPESLESYEDAGGFAALAKARERGADWVIEQVEESGLTGRGGAAFPTGLKWKLVSAEPGPRHLVCNADESEPGTFKDRYLMEGDPFSVIESVALAAFATGSDHAFIYIRGEYPLATARLRNAIAQSAQHLEGVTVEIRRGAGAYICGEETALFNSIEGFRGEPRQKPPYPTVSGLFGRPTAVNNVETLAHVLRIVRDGANAYAASPTRLFSLSGDVGTPGVVEAPVGATVEEVIDAAGGVVGELSAVLIGGAAGSFASPDVLSLELSNAGAREQDISLGSGVIIPLNTSTDFPDLVARIAEFFRDESCGQCVPCRVGTIRQEELVHRARAGSVLELDLLTELQQVMADASICGLGHTATNAVRSALVLGLMGGTDA
jgi:NADH-quinone oxidoreductase subunit F